MNGTGRLRPPRRVPVACLVVWADLVDHQCENIRDGHRGPCVCACGAVKQATTPAKPIDPEFAASLRDAL